MKQNIIDATVTSICDSVKMIFLVKGRDSRLQKKREGKKSVV
jgi:hypothetical protein